MKRTNIYMIEIAGSGGIWHYTASLVQELRKAADVTVVTGRLTEPHPIDPAVRILEVFRRARTNPIKLLGLVSEIARTRPDVVHFQLSQAPLFVLLLIIACKLFGRKVVVTAHNVYPHEISWWHKPLLGMLYGMADRLIVHSKFSSNQLRELNEKLFDKCDVVDHGNYMLFVPEDEYGNEEGSEILKLLFFGYIRHYKGLDVLLEALGRAKKEGLKFRLAIVGRPVESFDRYQQLIEKNGLEGDVQSKLRYVTNVEMADAFIDTNLVVLPYREISQSGVLQMAYAFGKPVVVTRVGGLPEVVDPGNSGLIVEPEDAAAMAAAILKLASDRKLLQRMSTRASELAKTRFSWDFIAVETAKVYAK